MARHRGMDAGCGLSRSARGASVFVDFVPWKEEDSKKIQGGNIMKKLIAMSIFVLLCLSCAGSNKPKRYLVKDVTEAELQRDRYECKRDAEMVCHMYGPGNRIENVPANIACFRSHFFDCMMARGYRWVEK